MILDTAVKEADESDWQSNWHLCFFYWKLVVRHPDEPLYKFEWGSLYMLIGDYMKAKECYNDAVSTQQTHQPRLEVLHLCCILWIYLSKITF